jgi:copper chaperone CopZ
MTRRYRPSAVHEYVVQGMTCAQCAVSVREEVAANDAAVRTAVAEAGYWVAS